MNEFVSRINKIYAGLLAFNFRAANEINRSQTKKI